MCPRQHRGTNSQSLRIQFQQNELVKHTLRNTPCIRTVFQPIFRFRIVLQYHLRKGMLVYDQFNYWQLQLPHISICLALRTNALRVEHEGLEKYVIGYGLLLTSINSNHYQKGKGGSVVKGSKRRENG